MFAVFGSTGTLGKALRDIIKNGKFHTRKVWDVENTDGLEAFLKNFLENVDIVINCVAYTDVDKAEFERDRCYKINVEFPRVLSKVCKYYDITLIHISSDYVFSGEEGFYTENDKPKPKGWYGETKRISEEVVLENCNRCYIVRTSWIFGKNGKNFFSTMPLKLLKNEDISTHDEQIVCPTPAKFLAKMLLKITEYPYGIYHITGKTPLTPLEGTILVKDAINSKSNINIIKPNLEIRPRVSVLLDTKIGYEKPPFVESILEYVGYRHSG